MNALGKAVALSAVTLAMVGASPAEAASNRYAMVCITNPTHLTVNYSFRWGNGSWESYTLAPGASHWHSWTYEYANQNTSPTPQIQFDEDLGPNIDMQQYRLMAYASPYQDCTYAKKYVFRVIGNGYALDLNEA